MMRSGSSGSTKKDDLAVTLQSAGGLSKSKGLTEALSGFHPLGVFPLASCLKPKEPRFAFSNFELIDTGGSAANGKVLSQPAPRSSRLGEVTCASRGRILLGSQSFSERVKPFDLGSETLRFFPSSERRERSDHFRGKAGKRTSAKFWNFWNFLEFFACLLSKFNHSS